MKWIFWIFNVVLALGLFALFFNLMGAGNFTISKYAPKAPTDTPTPLKYPTPVIKTPGDKQTYSGIVNNSVFYPERRLPTPEPTATTPPPAGTDPKAAQTPAPAAKQSERLDNVKYVTHFVNWGTPAAHLEIVNTQVGTTSLERINLNDEFKNWKVFEITSRRVVLKGMLNNEVVYHMFSPELSPMGQQLNKAAYDKILKAEAEAKTTGLPVIPPSKGEIQSMTPPPPPPVTPVVITPPPANTPVTPPAMMPTTPTPVPQMTPPPDRRNPRPFGRRDGRPPRSPFEKAEQPERH